MKNIELEKLKINEQSIKTELSSYENKPYKCLFEYIWNSFDAGATKVELKFNLPDSGFGLVENVKIIDNGSGWEIDNPEVTNNFISSIKINVKNKTLPKGKIGRGRYAFIWIAEKINILSHDKKLVLQHNTNIEKTTTQNNVDGTEVYILGITNDFSAILSGTESLNRELLLEFGWFLASNPNYKILLNDKIVDVRNNIKEEKIFDKNDFSEDVKQHLNDIFKVKVVLWDLKPSEYSQYYFLNENNIEIFKQHTGLNKKKDDFWHSVYISSTLFEGLGDLDEDNSEQQEFDLGNEKIKKIKNKVVQEIREKLILLRKPYLVEQSDIVLRELKNDKLIPHLSDFGIYDEESYDDLLKTIYTITPSLFVGKSDNEKKFICATFAGLLSTQDDILIKRILEQLQELTKEEQKDLLDILTRTSLSNVIKTIKEIDHRLDVLDKLKILISEHEKDTLEVRHIQKILDENFWIFGEQFRLFSTT